MTLIRFALIAFLASALVTAAGAADRRENRAVSGFNAISMAANLDLDVIQDGTESLALEGDERVLDILETLVQDGTLNFTYKRGTASWLHKRVRAVVHARRMDVLALSGTGKIHSPSLSGDSLTLAVSGAGDVDIKQVAVKKAQLSISGSGNVMAAGHADELEARVSGSGNVKAPRLETRRANVSIAGSGDATVWVKEQLAAAISGSGRVRYYGDPAVTKALRGVGTVQRVAAAP